MSITEFLEARIAEDEARATEARDWVANGPTPNFPWYGSPGDRAGRVLGGAHPLISAMSPARVLAECAAKRAIMDVHHPHDHGGEHGDAVFCDECQWDHGDDSPRIDNQPVKGFGSNPCRTLAVIAAVYADHPDYRQEWA